MLSKLSPSLASQALIILLVGITQYTQKGHIARATLEATCYQTKAILDAMEKDSGKALQRLAVDGGMSNSDLCMQVCQPHLASSILAVTNSRTTDSVRSDLHTRRPPQDA
jgi:glycerol kinase